MKIVWFFSALFPFPYAFFDSSNWKHTVPSLQLMYSRYYVKMQVSCERLCNCWEGSGREQEQLLLSIFLIRNSEQTVKNNAKACSFGLLHSGSCKNSLPTWFTQPLPRTSAVQISSLYSNCNTDILEVLFPLNLWKYLIPAGMLNPLCIVQDQIFRDYLIKMWIHLMYGIQRFKTNKQKNPKNQPNKKPKTQSSCIEITLNKTQHTNTQIIDQLVKMIWHYPLSTKAVLIFIWLWFCRGFILIFCAFNLIFCQHCKHIDLKQFLKLFISSEHCMF